MAALAAAAAVSPVAAHEFRPDEVGRYLEGAMQAQRIPGLAVAVIRNGAPLWVGCYGLANLEHSVPVHPDTMFASGSIGKQFTALAAMILVADGRLDLDASIRTYLPEAPLSWSKVTLRHLLNHTSGLTMPQLDPQRDYSDADILRLAYALPATVPPGTRWQYSSIGYDLAAILVTRVSGEFYGEVLKKRVFAPLGMTTARVISQRDLVRNRAAGYDSTPEGFKNAMQISATMNATGDGSIYLSVLDYIQWEKGLLSRSLLPERLWAEVLRPAPLAGGKSYPYGFGWFLHPTADLGLVWEHEGSSPGFRADIQRYERDGVTFVILMNESNADAGKLLQGVVERYDSSYVPPAKPIADHLPALTQSARDALRRLSAGDLGPKDFPDGPPAGVRAALSIFRARLSQVGECGELWVYEEQDAGDRNQRRYRASCRQGVLETFVTSDVEGHVYWLRTEVVGALDEPLVR